MPGSLSKKLPIVLFFFLVFCFLVLVWKSQVVVAWESGCYYCGSYSGGVLPQEPPKKFTNEAIEKMKKEGCKTVGTCNALSAGWELVGYTQPDGSIVYDCVGSGCCTGTSCDDREGGGGSGGSSFSCGRLVPPRCRDLLPIYSEDGDPYLAQGKGVFSKVLTNYFSNFTSSQADVNLYDDFVPRYVDVNIEALGSAGLSRDFFSSPEYVLFSRPSCVAQIRDDAYIYIPSGWYSFGVKANQSLLSGSESCYYCQGNDKGCPGNNTQTSWGSSITVDNCYQDDNGRWRSCESPITCSCDDIVGEKEVTVRTEAGQVTLRYGWDECSPDGNTHGCRFDCRGGLYVWMAAGGNGSISSPYIPNDVVPYDPDWVSQADDPQELTYSYDWVGRQPRSDLSDPNRNKMNDGVYGPKLYRDFGGKWVGFSGLYDPVEMRLNLGATKAISKIKMNFYVDTVYADPPVTPPKLVEIYCDGLLSSRNDYPNGSSNNVQDSIYYETVPLYKNCRELVLKFYHSHGLGTPPNVEFYPLFIAEVDVFGWNKSIDQVGLINPGSLEANFTRFSNWFPLVSIDFTSITGARAASTPNVDTVWSPPKYFSGGWYPIQTSTKYDLFDDKYYAFRIFDPQLWWRKCSGSDPSSCSGGERYTSGSPGGAMISACAPGSVSCSCQTYTISPLVSGEVRQAVSLATLKDYQQGSVSVLSSDTTALEVSNVSVSSQGVVTADLTAGNVDTAKTVNITVSAQPSDSSGTACGAGSTPPCTISVIVQPGKFWQAKNADVIAASTIRSSLPSSDDLADNYLLLPPGATSNDTPGIAFAPNISLGNGSVSTKKWKVNSNIIGVYSSYNYSYFENKVPSEVKTKWANKEAGVCDTSCSINTIPPDQYFVQKDGYLYYKVNTSLSINGNIGIQAGKKYVIFVTGDLNINGNITLSNFGTSFIMFVVRGKVLLSGDVTRLDGIYITDSSFETGTKGGRLDSQLRVNGTVVANSFNLQRSLPSSTAQTTPAELFEYKPGLILSMPYYFYQRSYNWREVNP